MQGLESEADRVKREADRLRAAERFMKIGTGEADCKGCGYSYTPKNGDPDYPVAPGTKFEVRHWSRCREVGRILCHRLSFCRPCCNNSSAVQVPPLIITR